MAIWEINLEKIELEEIKGNGIANNSGITHITKVEQAIDDLRQLPEDTEKWLVVFTDGEFEELDEHGKYVPVNVVERFKEYLDGVNDIGVCYFPICQKAVVDFENLDVFIPDKAKKADWNEGDGPDIAEMLLEVCSHIYGRQEILKIADNYEEMVEEDGKYITVNFDIPVSNCFIYAYSRRKRWNCINIHKQNRKGRQNTSSPTKN